MKQRKPTTIKSCPFCGSGMYVTRQSQLQTYVFNHKEYTECPFTDFMLTAKTKEHAIRRWNTRPAPGEKITKICRYYKPDYKSCFATKGSERCNCEGCRERCEL